MLYVSVAEYKILCAAPITPDERIAPALEDAQRDIDSLTFNRIVQRGFLNLTEFQKGIVQCAVCQQVNFKEENAELLSSPFSSYGIGGVSMSFDSTRLVQYGGVSTRSSIYALLRQTGLTYRGLQ